jgi:hypothetical protein
MPDWIKDLLKQGISSLGTAAVPSATNPKIFQLPFLNPQVSADLWLVTAVVTFAASFLTYGLAKPPSGLVAGTHAPPRLDYFPFPCGWWAHSRTIGLNRTSFYYAETGGH